MAVRNFFARSRLRVTFVHTVVPIFVPGLSGFHAGLAVIHDQRINPQLATAAITNKPTSPLQVDNMNLLIASWFADVLSEAWNFVGVLVLICGLAGILWGAWKFVESTVSMSLKDPSVIASLSLLIKPDLVFDENESVLTDRGASAAIKENGIKITKDVSDNQVTNGLPITIRIAFTKHLPTAPLLTPIGADVIFVTSTRGAEFEWVYNLKYSMRSDPDDGPFVRRYRLELM